MSYITECTTKKVLIAITTADKAMDVTMLALEKMTTITYMKNLMLKSYKLYSPVNKRVFTADFTNKGKS
jgi:hypothetical protein